LFSRQDINTTEKQKRSNAAVKHQMKKPNVLLHVAAKKAVKEQNSDMLFPVFTGCNKKGAGVISQQQWLATC